MVQDVPRIPQQDPGLEGRVRNWMRPGLQGPSFLETRGNTWWHPAWKANPARSEHWDFAWHARIFVVWCTSCSNFGDHHAMLNASLGIHGRPMGKFPQGWYHLLSPSIIPSSAPQVLLHRYALAAQLQAPASWRQRQQSAPVGCWKVMVKWAMFQCVFYPSFGMQSLRANFPDKHQQLESWTFEAVIQAPSLQHSPCLSPGLESRCHRVPCNRLASTRLKDRISMENG